MYIAYSIPAVSLMYYCFSRMPPSRTCSWPVILRGHTFQQLDMWSSVLELDAIIPTKIIQRGSPA